MLSKDLVTMHKKGVVIKVILDASVARNSYSMHPHLRKNGIDVKVENFGGKMHVKSMIIDDRYFISGSMNFTKAGVSKNDENTLVIENPAIAKKYKEYFLDLWEAVPDKYLSYDPSPESLESGNSCYDRIDKDFDKSVDGKDSGCSK